MGCGPEVAGSVYHLRQPQQTPFYQLVKQAYEPDPLWSPGSERAWPGFRLVRTPLADYLSPAPKSKFHSVDPGTVLEFDEEADCLRATKAVDPKRMRSVIGIGRKELAGKTTLQWLEELRGPVVIPPRRK